MMEKKPKYLDLVQWIRNQILEKKLLPGEKLYSENTLKEMFGISRQTVRHAISILENEGILLRVQGSGTYVADTKLPDSKARRRIAVVTTYVDGYIFPRTIQGIEQILFQEGYTVQIAFTNNQHSREKSILEDIIQRDEVAGIIMESTKSGLPNPNINMYHVLQKKRIPMLFINSFYAELAMPHVSLNDILVGEDVTDYLIEQGHRKIAAIFKLDDGQGHLRYSGYIQALNKHGLEEEDAHILWIDTQDAKDLSHIADRIVERIKGCSAVFCYNDEVAFGVLPILKERGISVPEDLSVVGVDDSELAVIGNMKITSFAHPMEELGEKSAKNLIEMIKNPLFDGSYEFAAKKIERDSVRKYTNIEL